MTGCSGGGGNVMGVIEGGGVKMVLMGRGGAIADVGGVYPVGGGGTVLMVLGGGGNVMGVVGGV